jgi:hypothetical protein
MNGTVSWSDRVTAYLLYRRSLGFSLMPGILVFAAVRAVCRTKARTAANRTTRDRLGLYLEVPKPDYSSQPNETAQGLCKVLPTI